MAAVVSFGVQLLTQRHQTNLQTRELEHQTRAALRETYGLLLVSQRRSREASLRLATVRTDADRSVDDDRLNEAAIDAHNAFIDHYHRLNLDATRPMWLEARGLRHVLDDMLKAAKKGDGEKAERLYDVARDARQNLERTLRTRLDNEMLQTRTALPPPYDKWSESAPGA